MASVGHVLNLEEEQQGAGTDEYGDKVFGTEHSNKVEMETLGDSCGGDAWEDLDEVGVTIECPPEKQIECHDTHLPTVSRKDADRLFHVIMIVSTLLFIFILISTFVMQVLVTEYRSSFCEETTDRSAAISQDWTIAGHDCVSRYGLVMKDPMPCMESILVPTLIEAKPASVQGGFLMFLIVCMILLLYYKLRSLFGNFGASLFNGKIIQDSSLVKTMRTSANVISEKVESVSTIQTFGLFNMAMSCVEMIAQWLTIMSMLGIGLNEEPKNVDYIHVLLGIVSMHLICYGALSAYFWAHYQYDVVYGNRMTLVLDCVGFIFDLLYLFSNYVVMLRTDCNTFACLVNATVVESWIDLISTSIPIVLGTTFLVTVYQYVKMNKSIESIPLSKPISIAMVLLSLAMFIGGITGWIVLDRKIASINDEWKADADLGLQFSSCAETDRLYFRDRAECKLVMIKPAATDGQILKVVNRWKYPQLAVLVTSSWSSGPLDINFENLRYAKFVIPANISATISSTQAEIKFHNQLSLDLNLDAPDNLLHIELHNIKELTLDWNQICTAQKLRLLTIRESTIKSTSDISCLFQMTSLKSLTLFNVVLPTTLSVQQIPPNMIFINLAGTDVSYISEQVKIVLHYYVTTNLARTPYCDNLPQPGSDILSPACNNACFLDQPDIWNLGNWRCESSGNTTNCNQDFGDCLH